MGYCSRCGGYLELSGKIVCFSCEAGGDIQCQRCGMYLPSHELQMWNSRLYCAYCIMDLQDEERKVNGRHFGTWHNEVEGISQIPCQNCWQRFSEEELRMRNGRLYCMHCLSGFENEEKIETKDAGRVACERCGMYFPAHELAVANSLLCCPYCALEMQEGVVERTERSAEVRIKSERLVNFKCELCGAYLPLHELEEIDSKYYCPYCIGLEAKKNGMCEKCGKKR